MVDRSGNVATATLGTVEINKNQLWVTVGLQGISNGVAKDVVFVLSGSEGEKLETRVVPCTFSGGVAEVVLTQIPDGVSWVSAKGSKFLRKRLPILLSAQGQSMLGFTGGNVLRGGDLTGENVVGAKALSLLRFYLGQLVSQNSAAEVADITGSGGVGAHDLAILRSNLGSVGDPE
jgi:hypothetical protein